jgi:hypothetical protein
VQFVKNDKRGGFYPGDIADRFLVTPYVPIEIQASDFRGDMSRERRFPRLTRSGENHHLFRQVFL